MENITIGQIAVAVAFVVALIGGLTSLKKLITKGIEDALKTKFESIEKSQKEILKRIEMVDLENCKNYIITYLSEAARGEQKDEIEIKRFYEELEHYYACGGNSYVRHKVEELQKKGLI